MSLMENTDGFRIRGWHVLVAMVLFFGVITAVNAVFISAALRTYPGEVSVTPYEDGLAYNAKLARQAAQAKLGGRPPAPSRRLWPCASSTPRAPRCAAYPSAASCNGPPPAPAP